MSLLLQTVDRYGRELYLYGVGYRMDDGRSWTAYIYAYDDEDAEDRVRALWASDQSPRQIVEVW